MLFQPTQERQRESRGLSGARLGGSNHVSALHSGVNGKFGLDANAGFAGDPTGGQLPLPLGGSFGIRDALTSKVALDRNEHYPMMEEQFPDWSDRIEYWHVVDLPVCPSELALP